MSKYKLLPVEPTTSMVHAAMDAAPIQEADAYAVYDAIRAAAPDHIADARKMVAAAAQGEPVIRKLGIMGAAFDPPSVRRAYTYSDQPNSTTAWKLGRVACKERSGGDFIDCGLQLLQHLQDEGFGVFEIDEAATAQQPECGCCGQTVKCDPDCDAVILRKSDQQPAPQTEMLDDDSLARQIGEIGNQIHNLGCEHQNDEGLADRLAEIAHQAWMLQRSVMVSKQQPAQDVAGLVEALEDISGTHHHSASAGEYFEKVAREALAAYCKGDAS